jgi:hypothetical protein
MPTGNRFPNPAANLARDLDRSGGVGPITANGVAEAELGATAASVQVNVQAFVTDISSIQSCLPQFIRLVSSQ